MIERVHSPEDFFAPITDPDDPSLVRACPGCGEPIELGDRPSLVNGVPASEDEAQRAAEGRAHNLEVMIAHQRCAYPKEQQ